MADQISILVGAAGAELPSVPASDSLVVRGDGCFEAIRSYAGSLFALDEHLERLTRSANAMEISMPPLPELRAAAEAAAQAGDGIVRVILSRGDVVPGRNDPGRCAVFFHPLPPLPATLTLGPVVAPWHPAGQAWELAGIKTTSYAPNLAASRLARAGGFDDALLVGRAEVVLEGPTFAVAWVIDGVLETPSLDLGILASITRRHVLELAAQAGIEVIEGRFGLARVSSAAEVMAWSTVKAVTPVVRVGDWSVAIGPVTQLLGNGLRRRVDQATLPHGTGAV